MPVASDKMLVTVKGATDEAIQDLLSLSSVCGATEDSVVEAVATSWGIEAIDQVDGMYL